MSIINRIKDILVGFLLIVIATRGAGMFVSGIEIGGIVDAGIVAGILTVVTFMLSFLSSASVTVALIAFFINFLAVLAIAHWYDGFAVTDTLGGLVFTAVVVLLQIFTGVKRG